MSWCSCQSLLASSSTLIPRNLLPSPQLLSLFVAAAAPQRCSDGNPKKPKALEQNDRL